MIVESLFEQNLARFLLPTQPETQHFPDFGLVKHRHPVNLSLIKFSACFSGKAEDCIASSSQVASDLSRSVRERSGSADVVKAAPSQLGYSFCQGCNAWLVVLVGLVVGLCS